MSQMQIFPQDRARARRADPETSHLAAHRKTASGTIGPDMHKCMSIYYPDRQYTAKEVGEILSQRTGNESWTKGKCWKRVSDAIEKGFLITIVIDGKELRRDGSRVLQLTQAGRYRMSRPKSP